MLCATLLSTSVVRVVTGTNKALLIEAMLNPQNAAGSKNLDVYQSKTAYRQAETG